MVVIGTSLYRIYIWILSHLNLYFKLITTFHVVNVSDLHSFIPLCTFQVFSYSKFGRLCKSIKKLISSLGNQALAFSMIGRDTYHYTTWGYFLPNFFVYLVTNDWINGNLDRLPSWPGNSNRNNLNCTCHARMWWKLIWFLPLW